MPGELVAPVLLSTDVNAIMNECVAYYESLTGKTLQPAQAERLLINAFAYREKLVREQIQYVGEQNLVDFANAPMLDYLAALVGVSRLAAVAAECEVQFNLTPGHGALTIPMGIRVQTTDGAAVFATAADTVVEIGVDAYLIKCVAQTPGVVGNGYAPGYVSVILDPQVYLVTAFNTTDTSGGADQENDTELRERIKLAPGAFSNAGSRGAYEYFAKSAHPSIIDVAVIGPPTIAPGQVNIYPLMVDGEETPTPVLDAVYAACNADNVRPLTDTVTVLTPVRIRYTLAVVLTLYANADATDTQALVQTAVDAFILAKRQQMGQDIVGSQVVAIASVAGVYQAAVTIAQWDEEAFDYVDAGDVMVIAAQQFAHCDSNTITILPGAIDE